MIPVSVVTAVANVATEAPVKVATTTGWLTAAGVWTTAIVVIGGVATAIVKQWATWKNSASTQRADDFTRLREDVDRATAKANAASDHAQRLENMVACMRPAISILMDEIRRLDPDPDKNAAIRQAQSLMLMAASGDNGFGRSLADLAKVER